MRLVLDDVQVSGAANHGIHVSDCSLADECGAGAGGGGEGSSASISVVLEDVAVRAVGNGKFDADGIRVDDRGGGSIFYSAYNTSFSGVGADGVELDEGGLGDVLAHSEQSRFVGNGGYCDPDRLAAALPANPEGEFSESAGATLASDVPPEVSGTPDDRCIEREVDHYESGAVAAYEFGIDVDDGIDYDEAGPGSLVATLERSLVRGNLDEGVDLDEGDRGIVRTRYAATNASDNADDGYKVTELGAGSALGHVRQSTAINNGGVGFVFEEESAGDVTVTAVHAHASNNDDGDGTGIEAVQIGAGTGSLRLQGTNITDGMTTEGVKQY